MNAILQPPAPLARPTGITSFHVRLFDAADALRTTVALRLARLDVLGAMAERVEGALSVLSAEATRAVEGSAADVGTYTEKGLVDGWISRHRIGLLSAMGIANEKLTKMEAEIAKERAGALKPRPALDGIPALVREIRDADIRRSLAAMDPAMAQATLLGFAASGNEPDVVAAAREAGWGAGLDKIMLPAFREKLETAMVERVVGFDSPAVAAVEMLSGVLTSARKLARVGSLNEFDAPSGVGAEG